MNGTARIVSLITLVARLVLAIRSFRGRGLRRNRVAIMGVAWAVIMAALAMLLQRAAA